MKMKYLFGLALATMLFSSCSEDMLDRINKDETSKTADKVAAKFQLTDAEVSTAFSTVNGAYAWYVSSYTEQLFGTGNNQMMKAELRNPSETASAATFNNEWNSTYSNLHNIYQMIEKCSEGGINASQSDILGEALILNAINWGVLTDLHGDIPFSECFQGISAPKYDTVEELYNWFFEELKECEKQLGTGTDHLTGDVTSMKGEVAKWKKYANSLRMRFAMRISDVAKGDPNNPDALNAQKEFEAAVNEASGIITSSDDDAFIVYSDSPFTEYPGAEDFDFRTNSLCQILYGQDYSSPTFISSTMFYQLQKTNDPRLYRFVRHYYNIKRSQVKPDKEGNMDLTDEVLEYFNKAGRTEMPCNPGAAWYDNWIDAVPSSEIPTLARLAAIDPNTYDNSDCLARLARPWLNIDFEMATCPGMLISYAEVEFLLAEAKDKEWNVPGTTSGHYEAGVRAAMQMLNEHYLTSDKITEAEITTFINNNPVNARGLSAKENINTQAWILHMMNPAEGWANMRRSDYPTILDRTRLKTFPSDGFVYNDPDMSMPTRLKYPESEDQYNHTNYREAVDRMGGKDDWHKKIWWDKNDMNLQPTYSQPYNSDNFGYIK